MITLEVCLDNIESVRTVAASGGIDRLELCAALALGGLSPSPALVRYAAQETGMGLHAMIRPRPGDFCFDDADVAAMVDEVGYYADLGAHGVVIGVLDDSFRVNALATEKLCKAAKARDLEVTFHRAVDFARDYDAAVETLIDLGVDRILTSGQADTALKGTEGISRIMQRHGDRISIMAGSGVSPDNAAWIVEQTGVRDLHFSASGKRNRFSGTRLSLGGSSSDLEYQVTDKGKLEKIKALFGR
ncbi:copper homeostasis protein CutC [Salidesulfovibrio onnuriiensis]|uniref:copper homeostasis protein CutC n=1 Tax=Salidesulfovibrio onnuriiensis TaxID=2583823 RepID=UPI001650BFEF|nr:copper homeostasis protein CutC [Salidesulfovibrio onnuriiensis]